MITKWYKEILKYAPLSASVMRYGPQIKCIDGTTRHLAMTANNGNPVWMSNLFNLSAAMGGFKVGNGTTIPNENDYAMESTITAGLNGNVTFNGSRNSDGNVVLLATITLQNTSSAPITISEVGYYGTMQFVNSEGASSLTNMPVLFNRAVLDTPVTINAGESAIINYRFIADENDA